MNTIHLLVPRTSGKTKFLIENCQNENTIGFVLGERRIRELEIFTKQKQTNIFQFDEDSVSSLRNRKTNNRIKLIILDDIALELEGNVELQKNFNILVEQLKLTNRHLTGEDSISPKIILFSTPNKLYSKKSFLLANSEECRRLVNLRDNLRNLVHSPIDIKIIDDAIEIQMLFLTDEYLEKKMSLSKLPINSNCFERSHLNKWQFKTQIMAEIELTEREELEIALENLNKQEEERKHDYKILKYASKQF